MNCKNCKWLNYYDGYFCGIPKVSETSFIDNIEEHNCSQFEQREGKFWTSEDGEF